MQPSRPVLSTLVLLLAAPAAGVLLAPPPAEAAIIVLGSKLKERPKNNNYRVVLSGGDDASATGATLALQSDAGEETLTLVESDAWLHGAATIEALPTSSAELSLTLYDADSAPLASFTGRLDADGTVTLLADAGEGATESTGCVSRSGCDDAAETRGDVVDIELLAAEVFADGRAWALGVDLSGADAHAVRYGALRYTPCDTVAKDGTCAGGKEVRAEVGWLDAGSVWEAEATLDHSGLVVAKVKPRDGDTDTLDSDKARLGVAWLDDGAGVNTLGTDDDPLTTLALTNFGDQADRGLWGERNRRGLTVLSEGWSLDAPLPTHAEIELDDGDTLTVPVNSYQRISSAPKTFDAAYCSDDYTWSGYEPGRKESGLRFAGAGPSERRIPLCCADACVVLVDNDDGTCGVSVTAYADDAYALPDDVELVVTLTGPKGEVVRSETIAVTLDDEVTAVFAQGLDFETDPLGLDLSGKVKLLGEADRRGRQDTLAKGRFYATFTRDADGDLTLGGSKGGTGEGAGDSVVPGDAVLLSDPEGEPLPPPAIQYSNSQGTKNNSSQASTKPQLL